MKITTGQVDLIPDDLDADERAYVVRCNVPGGDIPIDLGRIVLRNGQWHARDGAGLNKQVVETVADGVHHLVGVYNTAQ